MFDTMTFTKVLGAFSGALLIFLLGRWGAEELYHVGTPYGEQTAAYVIETEEEEPAEEVAELTFEDAYANADASAGSRVWGQCRACHQLNEGANAVGPYLHGVVGRDVGAVDDFRYSGALSEQADVWTPENISAFIENPQGWAPGTSMGYSGLDDVQDRANLIAYIEQESQ